MEAPVLLGVEEADDLFEGTTEKGDVSSFEVCAAAVLKGKEAWENGVGIRSLISRAVASAAPCWSKVVRLPRCRVSSDASFEVIQVSGVRANHEY